MKFKQNCWEFMNCGREPGGSRVSELGICPASVELRLDNVHDGSNAGRACWVVSGTMCFDRVQGTFAKKYQNCVRCDFYQKVLTEEFPQVHVSAILLRKLYDPLHVSSRSGAFPVESGLRILQSPNRD